MTSAPSNVTHVVAEPSARDFRRNTPRRDLRDLSRYRSLLWYLFSSGLRTEKAGTFLGFVWWLLDPVLLMLVYWFVFGVIFHRATPAYPVFILISLVSWALFTKSLQRSMSKTLGTERTMRQVAFPRSVIPISITLTEFAHFIFGLLVAIVLATAFYGITPSWRVFALIGFGVGQLAFTLGLAFLFAAANFFFRDTVHLSAYLFRVWYYLSPGIYPLSRIPVRYLKIYELNPFATFFSGYHWSILHQPLIAGWAIVYTGGLSLLVLLCAYTLFVRTSSRFVKLSS